LIAKILVGRYDRGKALSFCCTQKIAVLESLPSALKCGDDLVITERMTQGGGCALVKQNLHVTLLGSFEAALCVLENCIGLGALNSREPFQKLLDCSATFDVFEERFHRDASVLEKPSAADFSGNPLYSGTLCPIDHEYKMVDF
jgi:hypothetical protein